MELKKRNREWVLTSETGREVKFANAWEFPAAYNEMQQEVEDEDEVGEE